MRLFYCKILFSHLLILIAICSTAQSNNKYGLTIISSQESYKQSIQKDSKAKFFDAWNLTSTCTTSSFGRTNFRWVQQRRDYTI